MTENRPPSPRGTSLARGAGEFLTIVVGVLVALGLESLVSRAGEASEERAYIAQLLADLSETERQMEVANDAPVNALTERDALILAIQQGAAIPNEAIRAGIIASGGFNNPVPIFSAADALMDRGRLHVLTPEHRSAIAGWLSYTRDFELEPLYQKEAFFRERLAALRGRIGIPTPSLPDIAVVSDLPSGQDLSHLLRDQEAYAALLDLRSLTTSMRNYRDSMIRVSGELRVLLEELQ